MVTWAEPLEVGIHNELKNLITYIHFFDLHSLKILVSIIDILSTLKQFKMSKWCNNEAKNDAINNKPFI